MYSVVITQVYSAIILVPRNALAIGFFISYRQHFQPNTSGLSLLLGYYDIFALCSNLRPTG